MWLLSAGDGLSEATGKVADLSWRRHDRRVSSPLDRAGFGSASPRRRGPDRCPDPNDPMVPGPSRLANMTRGGWWRTTWRIGSEPSTGCGRRPSACVRAGRWSWNVVSTATCASGPGSGTCRSSCWGASVLGPGLPRRSRAPLARSQVCRSRVWSARAASTSTKTTARRSHGGNAASLGRVRGGKGGHGNATNGKCDRGGRRPGRGRDGGERSRHRKRRGPSSSPATGACWMSAPMAGSFASLRTCSAHPSDLSAVRRYPGGGDLYLPLSGSCPPQ